MTGGFCSRRVWCATWCAVVVSGLLWSGVAASALPDHSRPDTLGRHTFTVAVTSSDGLHATRTVTYTVDPSKQITVSHVKAQADGTITFQARVPGPGKLDVLETAWRDNLANTASVLQPSAHPFASGRAHVDATHAGVLYLKVTVNAPGKRIIQHHIYPVVLQLWVTYTPTGGTQRRVGFYGLHLGRGCPDAASSGEGTRIDCAASQPSAGVQNGLIALVHDGRLWTVSASGGSPQPLGPTAGCTEGTAPCRCTSDLAASFSPDGQSLALISLSESQLAGCPQTYPESTVELGIMRPDGSSARLLATIPKNPDSPIFFPTVEGPIFSPSGGEIAYVLTAPQTVAGPWLTEILLIDARTGRQRLVIPISPRVLLTLPDQSVPLPLAFSPDGTQLAFVGPYVYPNPSRISIVNTSTGKPIRSIQAPASGGGLPLISGISWGTNGLIAFAATANSSIYTVRPNGGGLHQMTQPPPGQTSSSTSTTTVDLTPEWSPNGASLMFDRQIQTTDLCAGCSSADYTDQVEVVPANGGRPQMIWSGGTGSWSPDGKQIAITSLQGGAMNGLWIVGAQGGSRRQIAGPTWLQGGLSISWQPLG